ncbi:MAG: hypothetical protein AAF264_06100 [Pseudomonadota bacterium]
MSVDARHYEQASLREEYTEYVFLGRLCQAAWVQGRSMEVLRSATDAFGYDLVLSSGGVDRHVQLKTTKVGGKRSRITVNRTLAEKASGCVVWLSVHPDRLDIRTIRWAGRAPGKRLALPDRILRHTKGDRTGHKAARPNMTYLNKGEFEELDDIDRVLDRLFGPTHISYS